MPWHQIPQSPLPLFTHAGVCNASPGYIHIERNLEVPELFIVEKGVLFMEADNEKIEAGAGSVLFHPAPVHQRGFAPSPKGAKFIWIHFQPKVIRPCKPGAPSPAQEEMLRLPALGRPRYFQRTLDLAYQILDNREGRSYERTLLLNLMLCRYSKEVSGRQTKLKPRMASAGSMVEDIRYWVEKTIHEPVSVSDAAFAVRKNPDYANRLFRKSTGISLREYITQKKMEKARLLLLEGRLVKEVAGMSGFADIKHFSKMFHKHHGLPPSAYRQSAGLIYRN